VSWLSCLSRPRNQAKPRRAQVRVARDSLLSAGYAAKSRSDFFDGARRRLAARRPKGVRWRAFD